MHIDVNMISTSIYFSEEMVLIYGPKVSFEGNTAGEAPTVYGPEVTLCFIVLFSTNNLYDHSSCLIYSFYAGLHASWAEWRFSNIFHFHIHASWAICV